MFICKMFQLYQLPVNGFDEFRLSAVQCHRLESFFFEFCKFFVLAVLAGTLCAISTKFICNMWNSSPTLLTLISADEKHLRGRNIRLDFMVSKLAGDKRMTLLTSLMVSVTTGLEFTIASYSTSSRCNDSQSKAYPPYLFAVSKIASEITSVILFYLPDKEVFLLPMDALVTSCNSMVSLVTAESLTIFFPFLNAKS